MVSVVKAVCGDASTGVGVGGRKSGAFGVGVHRGSVLGPLLFIIVPGASSGEFGESLPVELLCADGFVLISEAGNYCWRGWRDGEEIEVVSEWVLEGRGSCGVGWAGVGLGVLVGVHVVFAGRESWWRLGLVRGVFWMGSWKVWWRFCRVDSNVDFHCRRCLEGNHA